MVRKAGLSKKLQKDNDEKRAGTPCSFFFAYSFRERCSSFTLSHCLSLAYIHAGMDDGLIKEQW